MQVEVRKAVFRGLVATFILTVLILLGSRNLAHFDAALVAYTFSILFATFGLTYRYSMWLSRPPTNLYWRRGWASFFQRGFRLKNFGIWTRRFGSEVLANRFIFKRDPMRGLTHMLIMWGCFIAVAITFPLVFGWLYFEPVIGELETYTVVVFGFPTASFRTGSLAAFMLFHGLVWASFLVIAGVMLAMRRRMRDEGAASVQRFVEDFMPLILLFAVSLTGLMLTASNMWLAGYAFSFIMIVHAITVIGTFLWLPFGKFFHVFQRPAQMGVGFYKDAGDRMEKANCRRCGHPFSSRMHIEDLIDVERQLGYRYEIPGSETEHYQWICPPCRRASFAIAQGMLWQGKRGGEPLPKDGQPMPMPVFANPGMGDGPLGNEDEQNYHP
jgi:hypothetical protein